MRIGAAASGAPVRRAAEQRLAQQRGNLQLQVVESGEFAITAGRDDSSCYAGSYMATWAPADGDWKLQVFSWQDVETDMASCQ